MHSPDTQPTWKDRLSSFFCWVLVLSVMAFMTPGLFWISGFPRFGLLSVWGEAAQAEIVASENVVYASFPYDRTIHTVAVRTEQGRRGNSS